MYIYMAMSKQYVCDLCKKTFNQKNDFTRHKNKKTPCISLNEIQKLVKQKKLKWIIERNLLMYSKIV